VSRNFDAVLVIAFGGPQGHNDIRPFLQNVLRGRRVAPGRAEEVAHHYELFGGVSPLTDLTFRQASGLRERLEAGGTPLPVYVGMRNWHPFLADTIAEMSRAGIRHAIGLIASAHRSYSGCTQYRENVAEARRAVVERGLPDVKVTFVADWHAHPAFIAANADNVIAAVRRLPESTRAGAQLIFTAHSIPVSMAERYPYRQQYEETARLVAEAVATNAPELAPRLPHATVYQSRSGRPDDPWLGPDINEYLRERRAGGLEAAILCPAGFICDHVEVLYDLDVEAADVCREIGLQMVRAQAVDDHPRFIEMMAEVVLAVCRRYERGRPLEVVALDGG
jgi:protoporphyrin/coproporphyrin ferrochelatase